MIFPTETFILRGRDKRGDKIMTDSQLIKIPKFLEGEKLPEGYFEAPDPYRVHKFPKCDLRKLTEYAGKIGKAITDMTKEEVTASGCGFEFLRQEQRFYGLKMDDYFLPATCSGTNDYFDSLENIGEYMDTLKRGDHYPETVKAFESFKEGNTQATHYMAFNEIRLLETAELAEIKHIELPEVCVTYINTYGMDREVCIDHVKADRAVFRSGDKFHVCIKSVLFSPKYKWLRREYLELCEIDGLPEYFDLCYDKGNHIFRSRLFKSEKCFDTFGEAKQFYESDIDLNPILREIFGDT